MNLKYRYVLPEISVKTAMYRFSKFYKANSGTHKYMSTYSFTIQ